MFYQFSLQLKACTGFKDFQKYKVGLVFVRIYQHILNYQQTSEKNTYNHSYLQMKFIIKSGSLVKLYSGDIKIEALAQFLKESFANQDLTSLKFTDKDGDQISVNTQQDLDVLQEINKESQYVKLEFQNTKEYETTTEIKQTSLSTQISNQPEINQERKPQNVDQSNRSTEKQKRVKSTKISKDKSPRKDKKAGDQKKQEKKCQKSFSRQGKCQRKEKFVKMQEVIAEKITKLVDERIKALIPCIKNQLQSGAQLIVSSQISQIIHQGIVCNGCNQIPIQGVRYKCLECISFNLCEKCQEKIQHQHNLLKMKKSQIKVEKSEEPSNFCKIGQKFFRQFIHPHNSSSEEEMGRRHHHGPHHGSHHGHWRGRWRGHHDFDSEQRKQWKINKKMFKLKAIFGERENLKEFIEKNIEIKARDLIDLYATQNGISPQEYQQRRDELRKQKLSAFYDCPEEEFEEVVKQNPKMNFRDIIHLLKETGKRTHTGENFKRMRDSCRNHFRCSQVKPQQVEVIQKIELKVQKSKSKDKAKRSLSKGAEKKMKTEILEQMKSLFGEEHMKILSEYINVNFHLGKQGIIDKWISDNLAN